MALAAAEAMTADGSPLPEEDRVANLASVREERNRARRIEAMTLRLAGFSTDQIADRMGISPEGVSNMLERGMGRAENLNAERMREIEGARLDRAQAAIWTKVLEGDTKAVDSFLRISSRRARMYGLDAPTKIDLGVTVRQEMEIALNELQRVVMGEVIHVATQPERIAIEPD